MKKFINSLGLSVAVIFSIIATSAGVVAQSATDEPIITFKTNIYQLTGELNSFSLVIGGTEEDYIDIDCGSGKVEYVLEPAVYVDSTSSITGTFIQCQVTSDGIVKIYGDASKIDYFNASGCYISEIDLSKLTNLEYLDLSHNELTGLDLTPLTKLNALYLSDNTFSAETPLVIGGNKPNLTILEISIIEHMDKSFNLSDYPAMVSFDGYHNMSLDKLDPTGCPELMRLTLDVTNVETLDVTKNPNLIILNISDTRITSIDVSKNPYLAQLYCTHNSSINSEYKISSLDVTANPELVYLFCAGNNLTELDITKCPKIVTLIATDNYITSIDVSNNPQLYIFEINRNCLDFATLPFNPGTWNTYYYEQRNFDIAKSCVEGTSFDYSARVLREGTTTEAALYAVSETSGSAALLDASYYSYENGVFTVKKAYEDSVYIAFANNMFPDAIMRTELFKVKTEADSKLNDQVINFSTSINPGEPISFSVGALGATPENPVEFFVDLGDGTQKSFKATSPYASATANVTGTKAGYGPVSIYAPEGVQVTAFETTNISMYSIDVTKAPALRSLCLPNAGLYSIDLAWNRCLEKLDLSGNNLSMLSLAGTNSNYDKNVLSYIDLSNNKLSDLTLNDMRAIDYLNLSNNQLSGEDIDLSYGDYVIELYIANNLFEDLDLTYCASLKRLDISHNNISAVTMPTDNNLEYFACNNNKFTYATLPSHGNLNEANYIYAPQADIIIASKGPGADLSSQIKATNGTATQYVWKTTSGNTLVEGTDYSINGGVTKFINTNAGNIYCEMSNAAYPAFNGTNVLKTTTIETAGMPTNLIAEFTTVNDADSVSLSLAAAKEGISLYIDWAGNGNVTQYLLGDTYRLFSATTVANANVKVYTYEPEDAITVFSMTGAKLSSFDGSRLTDAINISVNNAGLSEIKLPENSTNLFELSLENNNFSSFDLSKFPELSTIGLSNNQLTSIDLSKAPYLMEASISDNQLSEITIDNDFLWALYLSGNQFSEISLAGAPNLQQVALAYNKLSTLDVESLTGLKMLTINNNNFTFKTLPLPKSSYIIYYYYNQAPIDATCVDGIVDLSDQAMVDGTATDYRWFLDVPVINEDSGELEGEELVIDYEYTLENGVSTFYTTLDNVMCVMTNSKLPDILLYTNLMNVVSGIEGVMTDDVNAAVKVVGNSIVITTDVENIAVALFNIGGTMVASTTTAMGETSIDNLQSGVYVLTVGKRVYKVAVK